MVDAVCAPPTLSASSQQHSMKVQTQEQMDPSNKKTVPAMQVPLTPTSLNSVVVEHPGAESAVAARMTNKMMTKTKPKMSLIPRRMAVHFWQHSQQILSPHSRMRLVSTTAVILGIQNICGLIFVILVFVFLERTEDGLGPL